MSVGTNISEDCFQHLDEFEPQTNEAVVKEKRDPQCQVSVNKY